MITSLVILYQVLLLFGVLMIFFPQEALYFRAKETINFLNLHLLLHGLVFFFHLFLVVVDVVVDLRVVLRCSGPRFLGSI